MRRLTAGFCFLLFIPDGTIATVVSESFNACLTLRSFDCDEYQIRTICNVYQCQYHWHSIHTSGSTTSYPHCTKHFPELFFLFKRLKQSHDCCIVFSLTYPFKHNKRPYMQHTVGQKEIVGQCTAISLVYFQLSYTKGLFIQRCCMPCLVSAEAEFESCLVHISDIF